MAWDHVVFLGLIISAKGLRPDPENTEKVKLWPVPRSATKVGAQRAAPVIHLTGKDVPCLSSCGMPSVLNLSCHPDCAHRFIQYTDASQVAARAVLTQDTDGLEKVVAGASHSLTAAKRLSMCDKELRAIVWAVRHFRHYLSRCSFTIFTDH